MTTAPGQPRMIGGVWYYIVNESQFQTVLATFKTRQEVDVKTEQQAQSSGTGGAGVRLGVLNGAGTPGLAVAVAGDLAGAGYTGVKTGNAESRYSRTTIYYSDGESSRAGAVAADLAGVQEPVLESSDQMTSSQGVDVLVVLGSDYQRP
jgi:predicted metalloprotease